MAGTPLSKGDRGAEIEVLQDLMNRTGALLQVDGHFGPATERTLREIQAAARLPATGQADAATWAWLELQPAPSPDISTESVTFIVREEVGGREFYESHTAFPHYPGEQSGVTIGIGYDLRFHRAAQFEADWDGALTAAQMAALRPLVGIAGSEEAVERLSHIRIDWSTSWRVFTGRVLPHFVELTRAALPGFDDLPPTCRGVLVSLVYNRGAGMEGPRRTEMRAIRDHLAAGRPGPVAAELESMKRLWPDSRGLRARRDKEAALWRKALAAAS